MDYLQMTLIVMYNLSTSYTLYLQTVEFKITLLENMQYFRAKYMFYMPENAYKVTMIIKKTSLIDHFKPFCKFDTFC